MTLSVRSIVFSSLSLPVSGKQMDYTTTAEKAKVTLSAETLVIHALQSCHGIVGAGN